MRIILTAVGRLKAGPERDVSARYMERAGSVARAVGLAVVDVRELNESRARRTEDRKAQEATLLRASVPPGARLVLLDEGGKSLTVGFRSRDRQEP